jgi:cytochrome P450/SAM-dependent methyltransferase
MRPDDSLPMSKRFLHGTEPSSPLYGGHFYANPYPLYRRIRESGRPFYNAAEGCWLVASYRAVAAVLKEPHLSKRTPGEHRSPLDSSMLFQDPPEHSRLRGLLADGFTGPKVAEMERKVEVIANRLLDKVAEGGRMEFISEFATPLPAMVVCELLGVGTGEYRELASFSHAMVTHTDENGLVTAESMRRIGEANAKLASFFEEHLAKLETAGCPFHFPKLLSQAKVDDSTQPHEKIATAILLLIAGHETTSNLLGNGLWLLMQHPEIWHQLRADPGLLDGAIEEMLRFESPVQRGTFRIVAEDFELGGCHIKKGDQVAALIGAANRDPEIFPNPDTFDIRRSPNRHLAFGNGPHFCMGASLARLEARVAFRMLLERFSEVRATTAEENRSLRAKLRGLFERKNPTASASFPAWTNSTMVRGLEQLPVEFCNVLSITAHTELSKMGDSKQTSPTDPLVDHYNSLILDSVMRSFYGESLFYNVGFRHSPLEEQAVASRRLLDLLLSWVPEPPAEVLDVACGLGATSRATKMKWSSASVTGINISATQIDHAHQNAPQCSFLQMDATSLDFPDGTFDLILCVEAAFHFNSRRDFLREAFRTLKKGGTLLLADILFHDIPGAEKVAVWPVNRINRVADMSEYLALLVENGFAIQKHMEGVDPCWKSWCMSLREWTISKHREGMSDAKSLESRLASLDSLSQVVKSYPLVCVVKPE